MIRWISSIIITEIYSFKLSKHKNCKLETNIGANSSHYSRCVWIRSHCHVRMGTPKNGDPGSPFSYESGDPGRHNHIIIGTGVR